jgi:hypothetical protein
MFPLWSFGRGVYRGRSCGQACARDRHQADQILAHPGLFEDDQTLNAGVEIGPRGADQLEDEEFVESRFGKRDDAVIRQWLMGELSGRKLLRRDGQNCEEKSAQNTHTPVISARGDGERGRISLRPLMNVDKRRFET